MKNRLMINSKMIVERSSTEFFIFTPRIWKGIRALDRKKRVDKTVCEDIEGM